MHLPCPALSILSNPGTRSLQGCPFGACLPSSPASIFLPGCFSDEEPHPPIRHTLSQHHNRHNPVQHASRGTRAKGRPRMSWMDNIRRDMNKCGEEGRPRQKKMEEDGTEPRPGILAGKIVTIKLMQSPTQVQSRYETGQKNEDIYSGPKCMLYNCV